MSELETVETVEAEEKERFEITDIASLTWVMREILSPLKTKIGQVKSLQAAENIRIEKWAMEETRGPLNEIAYWEQRITDYHLDLLRTDPKQKTLSTPYGKSKTTTSKASPEKADEDKLLAYAKENELTDLINVKESIKWGDLKKTLKVVGNNVVDANGEIVDGAVVKPETITCKVEVN